MADVKISALPLASTPLAGTEVLPIVQSATTDQVSVANLTAGRSVSAASLTLTTTPLAVGSGGTGLTSLTSGYIPYGNGTGAFGGSANLFWDSTNSRLGVGTSSPSSTVHISAAGPILRIADSTTSGGVAFIGTDTTGLFFRTFTADTTRFQNAAGTVNLLLDSSGNLGLGVTPSAWSVGKALEIGQLGNSFWGASTSQMAVTSNTYFNAGYKFAGSGYASQYQQQNGEHYWYSSTASGLAGNTITWTNSNTPAMTLGASGNLGLGATATAIGSYRVLQINGASGGYVSLGVSGTEYANLYGDTGTGLTITAAGARNIVFQTNAAERARIDSSGNLLVGTTSIQNLSKFMFAFSGASNNGLTFDDAYSGAGNVYAVYFRRNGSNVGNISTTASSTTYTTTSDISLKENITSASSSLASILNLPIRQFEWKVDGSHTDYGVVAQEANDYAPEIVTQGDMWSVDYGRITPRLIKAFQELAAEVAALKGQLNV